MSKRLLILSCSQRKRPDPGEIPAIERYDGPLFRILRKFIRDVDNKDTMPDVFILSARFGLISTNQLIPTYDQKMTSARAVELLPQACSHLASILLRTSYDQIFLGLSKTYLKAIAGYENLVPVTTKVLILEGSMGRRQADLCDWMYNEDRDKPKPPSFQEQMNNRTAENLDTIRTARIQGLDISYSPNQIGSLWVAGV